MTLSLFIYLANFAKVSVIGFIFFLVDDLVLSWVGLDVLDLRNGLKPTNVRTALLVPLFPALGNCIMFPVVISIC